MADEEEFETWRNPGKGKLWVHLRAGLEMKPTAIRGGQTFSITPADRRYNENKVADPAKNPFANSTLQRVNIPDKTESARFEGDPNALTEDDMERMLAMPWQNLQKHLDQITSPQALALLVTYADEHDASGKALDRIRTRLEIVRPEAHARGRGPTVPD